VHALSRQDNINGLQSGVFKGNEKMEQFKLQMNWNQEELEQWALAARQKEEDNLALLKCAAGHFSAWVVLGLVTAVSCCAQIHESR